MGTSQFDISTQAAQSLRASIGKVYRGSPRAIDRLLVCLLARGHCLIEDVPGVGKTVLASALARSVDASFSRIQLTPDLMPGDILGVSIFRRDREVFEFQPGPIFASVVLADEINRATPRTQTALLEAMNDGTVTVDGKTHPLPRPFMLVATQNPSDFEGTFPLPENQLDRFLIRISLGYPSPADEAAILEDRPGARPLHELTPVISAEQVRALQAQTDTVRIERSLREYIVAIAAATRTSDDLMLGLSTRGALALAQAARATAVLAGRDFCTPEDIIDNLHEVAAHRVIARSVLGTTEVALSGTLTTGDDATGSNGVYGSSSQASPFRRTPASIALDAVLRSVASPA
jgi:MoxR-like ATPase